jgi:hypothetical protein
MAEKRQTAEKARFNCEEGLLPGPGGPQLSAIKLAPSPVRLQIPAWLKGAKAPVTPDS